MSRIGVSGMSVSILDPRGFVWPKVFIARVSVKTRSFGNDLIFGKSCKKFILFSALP